MAPQKKLHGHPRFYELLDQAKQLHSAKNHDYAGDKDPLANFNASLELGVEPWLGCAVRMTDKWQRFTNFVRSGELKVKSESIKDTLIDLTVYCLIEIVLIEDRDNAIKETKPD